jgi:hypothetical protein
MVRCFLLVLVIATSAMATAGSGLASGAQPTALPPAWVPITKDGAPSNRHGQSVVWTGREVLIWGGVTVGGGRPIAFPGRRYDPAANQWRAMSEEGQPSPRVGQVAAWTGREMLIWGGAGPREGLGDAARYDPVQDRWQPMAMVGSPQGRSQRGVWTGQELLVYSQQDGVFNGAAYDPREDRWRPLAREGAPVFQSNRLGGSPALVWTAAGLVVWGGTVGIEGDLDSILSVGAVYDPQRDAWRPMDTPDFLSPRWGHSMVWTGEEVLIWGGGRFDIRLPFASPWGARYRPADGRWQAMSEQDAPDLRRSHEAFWTGQEMLIWGGFPEVSTRFTGGRYDPATDTWVETEPASSEITRLRYPPAVWTGTEMILWDARETGGSRGSSVATPEGARYTPFWIETRAPTEIYSLTDELLRIAEPGERYRLTNRAAGFGLVVRVGDRVEQSVWVRLDERIAMSGN